MGTQSPGSAVRTKRLLAEALLRLVEKRSFRKITVGHICGEAMISRSAFYSHFADKYELLSYCLEEEIRLRAVAEGNLPLEEQLETLLKNVQQHRKMLHNVFLADLSPELIDIFRKTLGGAVARRLRELRQAGTELPGDIHLIAAFLAGGLANVILLWIRDNCAVPAEEIAACQYRMLAAMNAVPKQGMQTELKNQRK